MKKERVWIVCLIVLFLGGGLLLSLSKPSADWPLDSRSNAPDGLRALYLTLEELGFSVRRKTGPIERTGGGVVLVFGPEYLSGEDPDAIDAWIAAGGIYYELEYEYWFANGEIEAMDVWELALELWPYRGETVWFDEYGRGAAPAAAGDAVLTPVNILPSGVLVLLLQLGLLTLLALLLYGVRLGPPMRAERGRRRDEREDIQALANLMERSRLLPDALRLCYRRLCETTRERYPHLEKACELQPAEADRALALSAEMDKLLEAHSNDMHFQER